MARCTTFSLVGKSGHVLILNGHVNILKLFQITFLPLDPLVRLCLFLPACLVAPETEDILNICVNDLILKLTLVMFSIGAILTSAPGAPIAPGVPDAPCKQRHWFKKHIVHY